MNADELIGITRPEDLFPGDPDKAKIVYRELAVRWHPDRSDGNAAVFAHVAGLYKDAIRKLAEGTWEGAAVITFLSATNNPITFTSRAGAPYEFGHSYVGDDHVSYLVEAPHSGRTFGFNWIKRYTYANERMRNEVARYLPQQISQHMLTDGRYLLRIHKTDDLIRLRDVVTHLGGLDSRHVAWVVSSLFNLACYLTYTGIVHHDISPDTYFISPRYHSGALLGGWWWAVKRHGALKEVPRRTYEVMPFAARAFKQASTLTDLECIKRTALECINSPLPEPMHSWLKTPSSGMAAEQYRQWQDILVKTFGTRKFVPLPIDADAVYSAHGRNGKGR